MSDARDVEVSNKAGGGHKHIMRQETIETCVATSLPRGKPDVNKRSLTQMPLKKRRSIRNTCGTM